MDPGVFTEEGDIHYLLGWDYYTYIHGIFGHFRHVYALNQRYFSSHFCGTFITYQHLPCRTYTDGPVLWEGPVSE